ncbi:hypothetical protein BDQ17DRAFT_1541558 [Cyathus striatus]|nr:hypothetical protein BDQ17DRAFT_1541558 [Cyathus striatus]
MCLSLSRTAPLSVSLYPHTNCVLLLQGIQHINQHANQIWCLSVSTDFLHWIKAPQTPKVGSALRKLIVKGHSTHMDVFRWFWKATELEEVRLELQGHINLKSTIENQIHLRSIKRLTLKRCRINGGDTVLALLKIMHSLEELIWINNTLWVDKWGTNRGSRDVDIFMLHTLKVSSGDCCKFWSRLKAHHLINFHVRNCNGDRDGGCVRYNQDVDHLSRMLKWSTWRRKNVYMDSCSNIFMISTINHVPDIEKLTLRMPATGSLTEVLEHLSQEKNPDKLPLLKELQIEIVKGFSPSVKDYLVEEVLKGRSGGLHESMEGSQEPVHLSYIKLSMEVPQSYYEEYTSPDTNLCMDDIKALAGELSMEIDFDIRVAELGEGVTGAGGREEEVSQIVEEMHKVSDGEDEGIWS